MASREEFGISDNAGISAHKASVHDFNHKEYQPSAMQEEGGRDEIDMDELNELLGLDKHSPLRIDHVVNHHSQQDTQVTPS